MVLCVNLKDVGAKVTVGETVGITVTVGAAVGACVVVGTGLLVGGVVKVGAGVGDRSMTEKLPAVPTQESSAPPLSPPTLQDTSEGASPPQQ